MQIQKLKGLIAAPFTPMKKDGSVNPEAVKSYYQFLKRNGVIGAFINGSTGEGVSQTQEEKKLIMKAWAEAVAGDTDFKVIALAGGTCLNDAIELAQYADECKLDAVALTAPYYFKPANIERLAATCQVVAEAAPTLPFYYYHIPVLNGTNLPMYALLQAVDGRIENFAGIKYTHEDFMDFLSCLNYKSGKYDMLWGRDENMLSALVLGTEGAVGSTYNYAAPLYNDMIAAFQDNDLVKARALQQQSIDMIRLLGKYGGIATGKAFMKLVGVDCGEFRLPVSNMSAQQFEAFKEDVKQVGFESFRSK